MAQNFIQRGDTLTLPAAPYALAPGDGALVGSIFGVSQNASESGEECVLAVTGVHRLVKVLSDDIDVGDLVWWDDGDKVATVATSGNSLIGIAVAAAGTSDTTVDVRLNGAGGTTDVPAEFADLAAAIDADGDGDAVVANHLIVPTDPPAAANSTGKAGTITWASGFLYVCVATDTWKRVAIASW